MVSDLTVLLFLANFLSLLYLEVEQISVEVRFLFEVDGMLIKV